MAHEKSPMHWLLLVVQLPASPSSARVALWRRLRTAGAASVMQGAWVLPYGREHQALMTKEASAVRANGGSAGLFACKAVAGMNDGELRACFRSDRAREYQEFAERSDGFFAEIVKETRAKKFTFAELEEIEDDLAKLKTWLDKIAARDFFPDKQQKDARAILVRCEEALNTFAEQVYRAEGAMSAPKSASRKKTR